jgi:hypothetical protein
VLLALRKEPGRRYASAGAFADDIKRHLESRPVHARPHTVGYLARRFIRRNSISLAVAATIAIAFVSIGATVIWQMSRSAEHSAGLRAAVKEALAAYQYDWRRGNPVGALNDAQRALTALKELALSRALDPSIREAEGYALQCLAIAQRARGDLTGAAQSYREAEELYRDLAARQSTGQTYLDFVKLMQRERAEVDAVAVGK